MYDDNYPTCEKTYATLRIYPGDIHSAEVSLHLGLTPSRTQEPGDVPYARPRGWFLSTEGQIMSRDVRRHLDWLLDKLMPVQGTLRRLQDDGASMDVSCYWLSASGHGGPTLSFLQAQKLAALRLDCWFDVYFVG